MTSQRARNRQEYNSKKKTSTTLKLPLTTSQANLQQSAVNLRHLDKEWQNLTPETLASLTEAELTALEQNLTEKEKNQLAQNLMAALSQTEQQAQNQLKLSWWNQTEHQQNSSQYQATHSGDTSGVDQQQKKPETTTGSPVNVSVELPEEVENLRAPLTGKHKRQEQDIRGVLALVAGLLVLTYKTTGQASFYADAETIGIFGPDVALSWARLGRKYDWLYTAIDYVCGASQVALMLASTGQMLSEIGKHHGIDVSLPGTTNR